MNNGKLFWLLHWICERERIRIKKDTGEPRPWTTDPILSEWRFCNVDRNQDKETKWIHTHIIGRYPDHDALWINLVIARFINWSPTLEHCGFYEEFDQQYRDHFVNTIEWLRDGDPPEKIYTGAYMIPAGPEGIDKHIYLADTVFMPLWAKRSEVPGLKSLCDWDHFLRQVPLMGDFLRNQIITDLRYTRYGKDAWDWDSFLLAGPGTMRGLNRLHDQKLTQKWEQIAAARAVGALRQILAQYEMLRWAIPVFRDINNVSNCLCEFDKYMRVLNAEGKPRSRYVPS